MPASVAHAAAAVTGVVVAGADALVGADAGEGAAGDEPLDDEPPHAESARTMRDAPQAAIERFMLSPCLFICRGACCAGPFLISMA
jgi:hypothetical protein